MSQTELAPAEVVEVARLGVEQIDPRALLIDRNVRGDARLDKPFVRSLQECGVLQPIIAVRGEQGIRVRMGKRRTLGAIEAGLETVPVVVVGDESTDDAAQIERIVQQFAENEHRAPLTDTERLGAVEQLAAFGVPAVQIARRTGVSRMQVRTALGVARSELASAALARYDLTLDQASVVAEFEDDAETVKVLVASARTGQFAHVAQRARDDRAERLAREAVERELSTAGDRVVTEAEAGASPSQRLTRLSDDVEQTQDRPPLTAEAHQACPGHAAFVDQVWEWVEAETPDEDADDGDFQMGSQRVQRWVPVYVCTDPEAHGHQPRWPAAPHGRQPVRRVAEMADDEREAARAARKDVIDSNRAWESAETVRRAWLAEYLTRKSVPRGTAAFLALSLARHGETLASVEANKEGARLFGHEAHGFGRSSAFANEIEAATDARAQVLHLGLVLAAFEVATSREDWRTRNSRTHHYLLHLEKLGYVLSVVEARACGRAEEADSVDAGDAIEVAPDVEQSAGHATAD